MQYVDKLVRRKANDYAPERPVPWRERKRRFHRAVCLRLTLKQSEEVQVTALASRSAKVLLFATWITLVLSRVGYGQTNDEVNAGIQFNFSPPGARSLALGGAFVGLADDATAAVANPAGLIHLSRPEVSAEGRRSSYTNVFTDRGHAFGDPTGIGVDTVPGIITNTSEKVLTNLSFTSFVYPRGRWRVAVYRQELADFSVSFRSRGIYFGSLPGTVFLNRDLPIAASLGLRVVNLGVSGAFQVNDALSLGLGLASAHFTLSSQTVRFDAFAPFFAPPDYSLAQHSLTATQSGSDHDVALNAGLLWSISRKWAAGAVYRQGPEFRFRTTLAAGLDGFSGPPGAVIVTNRASFHVPDAYAAGVAFQPTETLTITADYDRIRYSELTRFTVDVFASSAFQDPSVKQLVINDANEFHLGAEYTLAGMKTPLFLRIGGWWDPDHKIRFNGAPTINPVNNSLTTLATLSFLRFRPGQDEVHVTGGVGLVWLSGRFQLDAAYDYSRFVSVASLSGVVRF